MTNITLKEAQAHLAQLIHQLPPGEELVITENDQPVAKLARTTGETRWPCKAGSAAGKIHIAPDFNDPIDDFREYTE